MSTKTYGYYTAGWCGSCGRRRGSDGRCPNCDPWWTSPIVQIGGPLVIGVSLFLILGISILRGRTTNTSDTANTVANSSSSARRTNGFSSFSNAPASPYAMPQYAPRYAMPSSPTMSAPAPLPIATVNPGPMPPTPQQIQYAELQRLRQMTAYADAFVQATEQARAEQARQAAAAFSPMMPGRAMPASQMSQTQTFAMPM